MDSVTISNVGNVIPQGTNTAVNQDAGKEQGEILFADFLGKLANPGTELFSPDSKNMAAKQQIPKDENLSNEFDRCRCWDSGIKQRDQAPEYADRNSVREKLTAYENEVKRVLKDELGVTDEQIESAMEMLGLTGVDLMNPNRLAELVTNLTDCENPGELLCNNEFMAVLQEVIGLREELLESLGISAEELEAVLQITEASPDIAKEVSDGLQTAEEEPVIADSAVESVIADSAVEQEQILVDADRQKVETAQKPEIRTEVPEEEVVVEDVKVEAQTVKAVEGETVRQEVSGESKEEVSDAGENLPETVNAVTKDRQSSGFEENSSKHGGNQEATGETFITAQHDPGTVPVQGAEMTSAFTEQLDVQNIIRQIVEYTQVAVNNSATTLEMQLNPENLGKLYLEITSKAGNVSAHITVQNEAVKEAIETQIIELRQNMNQAGVKVDAVEVTVGSHEFERNLEQNARREEQQASEQERSAKQTRRINLNSLDELGRVMTEEESLVAQMMADQGNSVDFTA